jgi:IS5 family transposase
MTAANSAESEPANTSAGLYADAAYHSAETEAKLRAHSLRSRIHEGGCRSHSPSKAQGEQTAKRAEFALSMGVVAMLVSARAQLNAAKGRHEVQLAARLIDYEAAAQECNFCQLNQWLIRGGA